MSFKKVLKINLRGWKQTLSFLSSCSFLLSLMLQHKIPPYSFSKKEKTQCTSICEERNPAELLIPQNIQSIIQSQDTLLKTGDGITKRTNNLPQVSHLILWCNQDAKPGGLSLEFIILTTMLRLHCKLGRLNILVTLE